MLRNRCIGVFATGNVTSLSARGTPRLSPEAAQTLCATYALIAVVATLKLQPPAQHTMPIHARQTVHLERVHAVALLVLIKRK